MRAIPMRSIPAPGVPHRGSSPRHLPSLPGTITYSGGSFAIANCKFQRHVTARLQRSRFLRHRRADRQDDARRKGGPAQPDGSAWGGSTVINPASGSNANFEQQVEEVRKGHAHRRIQRQRYAYVPDHADCGDEGSRGSRSR
ncbi:hypothetical protein DdX_19869 [Ditylenchus destructor]|uniref:Uncharacterized protein n=1 Tax=Ditylenchus destructor TaxID=166010 RepID=A0AAD4QTY3_9BILA|nr:hypothetical protein DdX_19869 [Ditylenchus destructor]